MEEYIKNKKKKKVIDYIAFVTEKIKKSQYFYLKFPNLNNTKDDKKQNYTYTIEKE